VATALVRALLVLTNREVSRWPTIFAAAWRAPMAPGRRPPPRAFSGCHPVREPDRDPPGVTSARLPAMAVAMV